MQSEDNRKKPIFISLVGVAAETDVLYEALKSGLPKVFPMHQIEFLGDPFVDYSELKIGGKKKREFSAGARACFRWGLFYQFNDTIVRPVFEQGADIVVVRRFGYDLYAGAVAHEDCTRSLAIHHSLVQYGVVDLGICPPLYVFSETIDERTVFIQRRYFSDTRQRFAKIEPDHQMEDKLASIVCLIDNEIDRSRKASVA